MDLSASGNWQADLNDLFATLDRENRAFTDNLSRQATFHHDVALPALEAAAEALRAHARTCETGLDPERVFLIIRQLSGKVEFQYALVAEVRIEAVTPYVHCWFEENKLAEAITQEQGQPEKKPADPAPKPAGKGTDQPDEEGAGDDEGGEDQGGDDAKQQDAEPTRTKTLEVLSTWQADRRIEDVTREEILRDFVHHYQEAIGLARTQLHKTA
ncbi:hypothetical protein QMK33_22480 [Hymenobacter sp. H14-R3]|uniref:hypothetical protein n=1 Tax=Hymenobacter sp. H14-R3 TaxID=3046308 RepID=UPI0024BA1BCC|nr:hypothetical protein [Hymenobacter sp. H14-R3]MDJ0367918.1 hypothetical protein [Hymenobacter sp. H14-R3]